MYFRTVDLGDAEGWADTFTADGKRSYDDNPGAPGRAGRTFTGRADLVELQSAPRALRSRRVSGAGCWRRARSLRGDVDVRDAGRDQAKGSARSAGDPDEYVKRRHTAAAFDARDR